MSLLRLFLFASLISFGSHVYAQTAAPPIEQQMTAVEFKAAGLDKLTTQELASLNTWLQRTVAQESSKAAETAKREEATRHNDRLFSLGSSEAFDATLVGAFDGFGHGKRYTLDNGQVWEQVDSATMYGVKLQNPKVRLRPSVLGSVWYMRVDGRAVNAKVKRIK